MLDLHVKLQLSRQFMVLILLVVGGCLLISISLPWAIAAKVLLFLTITGYGSYLFWRYGLLKSPNAITQLAYKGKHWQLYDQQGPVDAELCGDSTVTTWVCVLRFRVAEKKLKRTCIIFCDALAPDEYQRLLAVVRC